MKRNSQVKLLTFLLLLLRLLGFTVAVDNVWMNGREWVVCTGTDIFVVFLFFFLAVAQSHTRKHYTCSAKG
jgi:hypothetical protein